MTERPATSEVVLLLQRFALASDRFIEATGASRGMHRTDLHALEILMREQRVGNNPTASQLGSKLGLTAAATTALVDRLENSGHATRERSETDRRKVHVMTTNSAREDGIAMFGPLARALASVAAEFTSEEQAVIASFLARASAEVETLTAATQETKRAVPATSPEGGAPTPMSD